MSDDSSAAYSPGQFSLALKIPVEYSSHREDDIDASTIARLNAWKEDATRVLEELKAIAQQRKSTRFSTIEQAEIISVTAPFEDQSNVWTNERLKEIASEILQEVSEPNVAVLTEVFSQHIKPMFQTNPHPSLNMSTGRKLPRPAGGPMASQDFYESQTWKDNPAAPALVSWCVRHIKV
ncbi:hypothetical protein V5O48_000791 [Marasmius crinis-equi]|uniref:Uncharacterized protein n=1 Tax=Marasmius crinis-equi TaxID=585013 RepID=A0ABR3G086_9AGAR